MTDPAASTASGPADSVRRGTALAVLTASFRLGLTSFGGPTAHVGYFREEYVRRRRWLDEDAFGELAALCQFLPGPASSQLGVAIGIRRAGGLGGLAAFVGFTLPSAVLMVLFAFGIGQVSGDEGWIRGLKLAAVAVVAQAVWAMWGSLAPDRPRATLAVASAALVLVWPTAFAPPLVVAACALIALRLAGPATTSPISAEAGLAPRTRSRAGPAALALFVVLLVGLPLARAAGAGPAVETADAFYRSGALVFGGGHVVLPLLERETVGQGFISEESFLAGYGAAQALPGPLFTFAAYLGADQDQAPNGILGAALALGAVFLPGMLLVVGVLPLWERLRDHPGPRAALRGAGASVVGILLAALYDPVFTGGVRDGSDLAVVVVALLALTAWRAPPWAVVAGCAAAGTVLG